MKTLIVDSNMRALIGGSFYPKGYSMVMYATESQARASAQSLFEHGFTGDDLYFIPPADMLAQVGSTIVEADEPLPSVGTEAHTALEFVKLAREGGSGLLISTPDDDAANRMMSAIQGSRYSIARRYYALVIEDL